MTLVKDGGICYSFVTNQGNKSLVRYNHGTSFSNNPVSWTNLGGFGMLGDTVMGVKICFDNGQWIGFLNNNNRIVRLNFGSSPGNIPTATLLGPYAMLYTAHALDIIKEGANWVGFLTCSWGNKMVRLNFGTSLLNTPILTDLGIPGSMNMPAPFRIIAESGIWYALVVNFGNNTLTRLTFGNSLFNNPVGVNIGVVCPSIITPGGLALIRDCDNTTGFQLNYSTSSPDLIWRLTFPTGITGTVSGISLGNIGAMSRPNQFSELFRVGDTLFLYNTNRQNFTLTRLRFLPCSNASVPSSMLFNPPPFSYNLPGNYSIQLIVNEGLPDQVSACQNIIVMPPPSVNLGDDFSICPGTVTTLNAGAGFSSYQWSTGATTQSITVGSAGNYWVQVIKFGCIDYDTVGVTVYPEVIVDLGPDPVICEGQTTTFNAGLCAGCSYIWSNLTLGLPNIGTGPTYTTGTAGLYSVKVTSADGCIDGDTLQLFTNPTPILTPLPVSQPLCSGDELVLYLSSNVAGSDFFWTVSVSSPAVSGCFAGTGNVIDQYPTNSSGINESVTYHITTFIGTCIGIVTDYTVIIKPLPVMTIVPPSQSVCSGSYASIALFSNVANTSFYWVASGSSGFVYGFSSGSGSSVYQALYNSGSAIETVTYEISCSAAGCSGILVIYEIPVIPVPNVVVTPPNQTICSGNSTSIALTASSPLTNFSWTATLQTGNISGFSGGIGVSINQLLLNNDFTPGIVNYNITAFIGSCISLPVACPVTINPSPSLTNAGTVSELCSGMYTSIPLLSNIPEAIYTWTAEGSSPDLSGYSSGFGLIIAQQLFNIGFSSQTVTYTVTPNALGCNGEQGIFLAIVHPIPDIYFTPDVTNICTGEAVTIDLQSHMQPVTFSWTAAGSSANITNFSGGSGQSIQQTPLNSGPDPETVTYYVTPFSNGCYGAPVPYIATIYPDPVTLVSTFPSSQCSGEFFSVNLSSATSGTSFTWSASASSPLISGYGDGSGTSIYQELENPSPLVESVTYLVLPFANGCSGDETTIEVFIKPNPDISISPSLQSVCYGQQAQITLSSSFSAAVLSWTATGSSPAVIGYSNGTGNIINQSLFTAGSTSQTVTYAVISELNGCISETVHSVVITYPIPGITVTPAEQSICSGESTSILLQSQLIGTNFLWSASGPTYITGFYNGNGPIIEQFLENSSYIQGSVLYTITPSILTCTGPPEVIIVYVNPKPSVSYSGCNDTITTVSAQPFLLHGGLPHGGIYSGQGVDSDAGLFNPAVSGTGSMVITYSYSNVYGCVENKSSYIHVLPEPAFICGGNLIDVRDGHSYSTFNLPDGKCWMKENLDYGNQIMDLLPQTDNCIPEKYLHTNALVQNQQSFYQWNELLRYEPVAGSQGLCPPAWHVPTSAEWNELLDIYMGPSLAAGWLKDSTLSNGFHAIPMGFIYLDQLWVFSGFPVSGSFFWTSTSSGQTKAMARGMNNINASVSQYIGSRANAFSVRCIKDN